MGTQTLYRVWSENELLQRHDQAYRILSEKEIWQRQDQAYTKLASLLPVSKSDAGILLRCFKWSLNKVVEQWFEDEESVRRNAGLHRFSRPEYRRKISGRPSHQQGAVCAICLEAFPFSSVSNMKAIPACGHFFCDSCWTGYIHTAINDGPGCISLRCPNPKCDCAIGEDLVLSLITCLDDRRKYSRYLLRSFVEDNREAKWCPAPGCEYAVLTDEPGGTGAQVVICKCSFVFCWNCKLETHRPVDCETVSKWTEDLRKNGESENINWILANSQLCPKCKRPIEKNQGCMHMTCFSPCRYEFCWICLGPWKDHRCHQFSRGPARVYSEADRRRDMAKSSLDRYTHYYERWASNEQSRVKAQADLRQMEAVQLEKLAEKQYQSVPQLKFITEAWKQIVECRRVLKWTYAYGYYLPQEEQAKKDFFEYLQGEAEAGLERLHRCAEKDLLVFLEGDLTQSSFDKFRITLAGLTAVTRTYFDNLVKALENGLTDVIVARGSQVVDGSRAKVVEVEEEGGVVID